MVRVRLSCHTVANQSHRVYGRFCSYCESFKVSIDGSTTQRLNSTSSASLNQRMIRSNTSLDPGRHTVTLTYDDSPTFLLFVDFFR